MSTKTTEKVVRENVTKVEFGKVGVSAAEVEAMVNGQPIPDTFTDAEVLDRELRAGFTAMTIQRQKIAQLIEEAKTSQIHKTLTDPETGKAYRSLGSYLGNVIATLGIDFSNKAHKADRDFIVILLLGAKVSQSQVATALDLSIGLVNKIAQAARAAGELESGKVEGADGVERDGGSASADDKERDSKVVADAKRLLTTVKRIAKALSEDQTTDENKATLSDLLAQVQTELTSAKKAVKA